MMRRLVVLFVVLFGLLLIPSAAQAGGEGHDSCPKGFGAYTVTDVRSMPEAEFSKGSSLRPVRLPAGEYVLVATGSIEPGQSDVFSSEVGLYGALCGKAARDEDLKYFVTFLVAFILGGFVVVVIGWPLIRARA